MIKLRIILSLLMLQRGNCYIHMSRLRMKLMNSILINSKVKNDFKTLEKNEAFQLSSFWYDELSKTHNSHLNDKFQGVEMLYHTTNYENNNLINFKYDIISNNNINERYLIWRPKIQLCLHESYDAVNQKNYSKHNPTLYPSFRESIYLMSIESNLSEDGVKITNLVKSPFWVDNNYNSSSLFKESMDRYFISYLKYPSLEYNECVKF